MKVALLPWGDLIEDFLDSIGLSFEAFRDEMTGGWLFGYIEALKQAGTATALFCFSARVTSPERHIHGPTGTPLWLLPTSRSYRRLRQGMHTAYGRSLEESFGGPVSQSARPRLALRRAAAPYFATPVRELAAALGRESCTAILCQEYEYARFDVCVLLGRQLNLPVFATFQGGTLPHSHFERLVRARTVRACAGLIVPSSIEAERVQGTYRLGVERLARIFNPLDLGLWQHWDRNEARAALGLLPTAELVVWHGRVQIETKGLDVLADAWERLCAQFPSRELCLLLVGTGSDAPRLRERLAPLRGVRWVDRYINDRAAMSRYLCAADVYTLPSRREGFAVAPLEAMACGLPVVAADAPGVPDLLAAGENSGGIVVPRGDAVALAAALNRVLSEPDLRRHLGIQARRRVEEHFSLAVVGAQLRDFLKSRSYNPLERRARLNLSDWQRTCQNQ